jgi:hypothetical protein
VYQGLSIGIRTRGLLRSLIFRDPTIGTIPPDQATTFDRWYATDRAEEFARLAQAPVEPFYREYPGMRKRTTPAFFAENRGTGDVCILVCDGLKGLPQAVNTVWDRAIIQTCVIHLLRNTFRYASRK